MDRVPVRGRCSVKQAACGVPDCAAKTSQEMRDMSFWRAVGNTNFEFHAETIYTSTLSYANGVEVGRWPR